MAQLEPQSFQARPLPRGPVPLSRGGESRQPGLERRPPDATLKMFDSRHSSF